MTPVEATDRLLCVPPCVCTVFRVYRLARGPFNNMTPAMGTDRLLCVPPCVCTVFRVHRLARGPLNKMTPVVGGFDKRGGGDRFQPKVRRADKSAELIGQGFAYPPRGGEVNSGTHPPRILAYPQTDKCPTPPQGGGGGLTPTHPPTYPTETCNRQQLWGFSVAPFAFDTNDNAS